MFKESRRTLGPFEEIYVVNLGILYLPTSCHWTNRKLLAKEFIYIRRNKGDSGNE
jgi:hypothetical protein